MFFFKFFSYFFVFFLFFSRKKRMKNLGCFQNIWVFHTYWSWRRRRRVWRGVCRARRTCIRPPYRYGRTIATGGRSRGGGGEGEDAGRADDDVVETRWTVVEPRRTSLIQSKCKTSNYHLSIPKKNLLD